LRILKRRAAEAKCGLSKTALYDKIQKGKFPKPVKLSPKSVGWLESELDQWIEARIRERDSLPKRRGE
jgi:prophage regulatory protein